MSQMIRKVGNKLTLQPDQLTLYLEVKLKMSAPVMSYQTGSELRLMCKMDSLVNNSNVWLCFLHQMNSTYVLVFPI